MDHRKKESQIERRFVDIENKSYEILTHWDNNNPITQIIERSKGFSVCCWATKTGVSWLINILWEALSGIRNPTKKFFWRKPFGKDLFHVIYCQNSHGNFLAIDWYTGNHNDRPHHLIVPEGKEGQGWKSFKASLELSQKREKAASLNQTSHNIHHKSSWPNLSYKESVLNEKQMQNVSVQREVYSSRGLVALILTLEHQRGEL